MSLVYDFHDPDPSFSEPVEISDEESFSEAFLVCTKCGERKPLSQIHKYNSQTFGSAYCYGCEAAWKRAHYARNPEKHKARHAAGYAANAAAVNKRNAQYSARRAAAIRAGTYVPTRPRSPDAGQRKVPRYYELNGEVFVLMTATSYDEEC